MRFALFAFALSVFVSPGLAPAQEPVPLRAPTLVADPKEAQAELDKLQGAWDCKSWVFDGKRSPNNGRDFESIYEGNLLTLKNKGKEYRHGLVTLNPAQTPKAVNTWDLDGPFADRTNRGIYEFDGDKLKVCFALDAGADRPTDFESQPGSRRLSIIYERRKP